MSHKLPTSLLVFFHSAEPHGGAHDIDLLAQLTKRQWPQDGACLLSKAVRVGEVIVGDNLQEIKQQIGEVVDNVENGRFWVLQAYKEIKDEEHMGTGSYISPKLSVVIKNSESTNAGRFELFPIYLVGETIESRMNKIKDYDKPELPDEIKKIIEKASA